MKLLRADITTLPVDAIVNAANASLLGGGGVDGAIHRAAGPDLVKACAKLDGCETGDAKATPGFRLAAKYVFHAVGPVWRGGGRDEAQKLASCYRRCMELAAAHGINSIAFPAISCGIYGYPAGQAAEIAIGTVHEALGASSSLEVIFALTDPAVFEAYQIVLAARRDGFGSNRGVV